MRFAICPFHLSKVPCLPRKSEARSYEVVHLSRKIILANLKIWCSKTQPLSENQRPDLLTSLTHVSLVLRLPREMRLCRPSLPKSGPNLRYFVHFDLEMYFAPQRRATFHLSSDQMAPNSALERAYFSNLRSHKTLVKHTVSRLFYLFGHLHLLSSDYFSSDSVSSLAARTIVAASVHKSEV